MIATKRVGIFGGTFDPIHNGHLHLINEIARAGIFSTLIIVPSGNPWQKKPQASAEDRLEMTRLALSGLTLEKCEVLISDFEVVSSEPSYAIKTVMHLQEKMSGAAFTWIVGSDAASSLSTWHQVQQLATLVDFLIITRPGFEFEAQLLPKEVSWSALEIGALDISATKIRQAIAQQHGVSGMLPSSVATFISSKGLYGAA